MLLPFRDKSSTLFLFKTLPEVQLSVMGQNKWHHIKIRPELLGPDPQVRDPAGFALPCCVSCFGGGVYSVSILLCTRPGRPDWGLELDVHAVRRLATRRKYGIRAIIVNICASTAAWVYLSPQQNKN